MSISLAPGDIKRAQGAQLILNGMNLELWFQRLQPASSMVFQK